MRRPSGQGKGGKQTAVQNAKLEGIDDDEIEGNLNIDAIEGEV